MILHLIGFRISYNIAIYIILAFFQNLNKS